MSKAIALIVAVIAVLAAFAPMTSAETEAPTNPESMTGVQTEAGNVNCGTWTITNDVVTGTCLGHATSTNAVTGVAHTILGETVGFNCIFEMQGAINSAGEGRWGRAQVTIMNPATGGIDCVGAGAIRPCTATEANNLTAPAGAHNWHFTVVEDQTNGSEWMNIKPCLADVNVIGNIYGHVWGRLSGGSPASHPNTMTATDHRFRETLISSGFAADYEITGAWSLETGGSQGDFTETNVELNH